MGNIVLLDDLTINKIAAGEVIERPASVIKEMLENSIDAGADKITIEIKNGGISYIKITDNGKGIAQDDLEMAFERHATSKIRSAKDLDTVTSMGFRGEALASIAAVSHIELVSKTKEQENGYKVILEAGDVVEKQEIGCSQGTTINVTNLFFNTPVRYKFLKKDYTEAGYVEDVVTRIALVNPKISIKLINSGKTIIQTPGNGDLKTVVYSIYGKDVSEAILNVDYENDGVKVIGVIGKPEIARSNRSNQLFFVNKRYIRDKILSVATEQAYKGIIPIGKFGFAILNLEMGPNKVDVNVHPAKLEVRFQEENKVFQAIYHSIKDTLLKADLVANSAKEKGGIKRNMEDKNRSNINPREKSFEQRLAEKMQEKEKEKANKGLFSFGRQNKKIEEYNDKESKIKTNNIIEDLYKSKSNDDNITNQNQKFKPGETLNTSDVLLELRKMQTEIESDLEKNNNKVRPVDEEKKEKNNEDKIKNITEKLGKPVATEDISGEELQRKVESFLNNASKIKEKNSKILEQDYDPLKKLKDKGIINLDFDKIESSIEDNTQDEINIEYKSNKEENRVQEIEENQKDQGEKVLEDLQIPYELNEEKKTLQEIIENKPNEEESQAQEIAENKMEEKDTKSEINLEEFIKQESFENSGIKELEAKNNENKDNLEITKSINIQDEEIKQKEEKLEYIKGKIDQIKENPNIITQDFKEMYAKLFGTVPKTEEDIQKEKEKEELSKKINATDIVKENISLFEEEEEYEIPKYKFLGIAFRTYIILEMNEELYILDQHAAHERIMYEKVKNNYYSETKKDSQMLLLPDIISLTHKEMDIAKDNMQMFEKAGFTLEEFGENTIKLTGCPTICLDLDTKELFLETLDEINTVARTAKQEKEEKFIATVACKAAVKAHMALSKEEVDSLMSKLLKLPNPFTCPHGRPTAIKMTKYDIERKFARK